MGLEKSKSSLVDKLISTELKEIKRLGNSERSEKIAPKVVTYIHFNIYTGDCPETTKDSYIILSKKGIVAVNVIDNGETLDLYNKLKETRIEQERDALVLERFYQGKFEPFQRSSLYDWFGNTKKEVLDRAKTIRRAMEKVLR